MDPIYQRVMQRIFNDMLHNNVECHVNDLVVKFREKKNEPSTRFLYGVWQIKKAPA